MRAVAKTLAPLIAAGTPVIVCAKGIERGSKKFMSEVIAECAPGAVPAILSGPSFAADVARGLPTAVTLAAADGKLAGDIGASRRLGDVPALPFQRRARRRDRRRGKERARHRRRRRHRARPRRQRACGADHARFCRTGPFRQSLWRETGNHDGPFRPRRSPATCSSPQSRNFTFGVNLGRGQKPDAIHAGLAEGVFTAPVLLDMARERSVDMPISAAVAALLDGKMSVDAAIESLLTRPLKAEG